MSIPKLKTVERVILGVSRLSFELYFNNILIFNDK